MSGKVPSITINPSTLEEYKNYFQSTPNPGAAKSRAFVHEESDSSPELSDSFKLFLESARKTGENDKESNYSIELPDDFFGENIAEIFDEDFAREKTLCEYEEKDNKIRGLKIRDSLMLAVDRDRPSLNVTKILPHYNANELSSNGQLSITKTPIQHLENPFLSVEKSHVDQRTPQKNSAKKDKFSHIRSPVAEYINSPRCPPMSPHDEAVFVNKLKPLPIRILIKPFTDKNTPRGTGLNSMVIEKKQNKGIKIINYSISSDDEDCEEKFNMFEHPIDCKVENDVEN